MSKKQKALEIIQELELLTDDAALVRLDELKAIIRNLEDKPEPGGLVTNDKQT